MEKRMGDMGCKIFQKEVWEMIENMKIEKFQKPLYLLFCYPTHYGAPHQIYLHAQNRIRHATK